MKNAGAGICTLAVGTLTQDDEGNLRSNQEGRWKTLSLLPPHRHTKKLQQLAKQLLMKSSRKDTQLMIKRRSHKISRMDKDGIVKTQSL